MNQSILKARSQQLAQSHPLQPNYTAKLPLQRHQAPHRPPAASVVPVAKPRFPLMGLVLIALIISNAIFATGFFLNTEIDVLLGIREQQVVRAYEDRVTGLRMQVDRLRSSQVANRGNINLQMQELMRRQGELNQRQNYVRSLASRASELGLASLAQTPLKTGSADKSIITGSLDTSGDSTPFSPDTLSLHLDSMNQQTLGALAMLEESARDERDIIRKNLRSLGVRLPAHQSQDAVGGPYLPAEGFGPPDETFIDSAQRVTISLAALDHAKKYLLTAPLLQPIRGKIKVSSRYGSRRDPFHGKRAFHAGIDFKAKTGTPVRATGAGKVVFAGRRGGYGNSVEIEHTDGLTTRYGHLSKIYVHTGAHVEAGQNIGAVGATGRATGPHLHYEVRDSDGDTSDPAMFIRTGYKLRAYF